jgi:hypothetical protein
MAQINPMTLKRLVGGQARSVENLLSQGLPGEDDPKSLIRQILGRMEEETIDGVNKEDRRELESAARELEAAQAQSAQKWVNGELSLHIVLPFVDHEPVDLHFQKPARKWKGMSRFTALLIRRRTRHGVRVYSAKSL